MPGSLPCDTGQSARPARPKLLIVDDDPNVTETFARMLRLEGYEVLTALDVETALRELETGHPDGVFLDLCLPGVDGLAFLRGLRAQEDQRHTPVAIVTGDYLLDQTIVRELEELNASVHFKPLTFEDVLDLARELLDRADQARSS